MIPSRRLGVILLSWKAHLVGISSRTPEINSESSLFIMNLFKIEMLCFSVIVHHPLLVYLGMMGNLLVGLGGVALGILEWS